jgi:hypothetical protein
MNHDVQDTSHTVQNLNQCLFTVKSSAVGDTLSDLFSLLTFLKMLENQCNLPTGKYHKTANGENDSFTGITFMTDEEDS